MMFGGGTTARVTPPGLAAGNPPPPPTTSSPSDDVYPVRRSVGARVSSGQGGPERSCQKQLMSPQSAMRRCDSRSLWTSVRKLLQASRLRDGSDRRCCSGATRHHNKLEDSTSSASNFSPLKSRSIKVRNPNGEFKTITKRFPGHSSKDIWLISFWLVKY